MTARVQNTSISLPLTFVVGRLLADRAKSPRKCFNQKASDEAEQKLETIRNMLDPFC
jgi:hypothetical protein